MPRRGRSERLGSSSFRGLGHSRDQWPFSLQFLQRVTFISRRIRGLVPELPSCPRCRSPRPRPRPLPRAPPRPPRRPSSPPRGCLAP
eukprot:1861597-Pyramimonas_sp.AAC.1